MHLIDIRECQRTLFPPDSESLLPFPPPRRSGANSTGHNFQALLQEHTALEIYHLLAQNGFYVDDMKQLNCPLVLGHFWAGCNVGLDQSCRSNCVGERNDLLRLNPPPTLATPTQSDRRRRGREGGRERRSNLRWCDEYIRREAEEEQDDDDDGRGGRGGGN